MEPLSTASATVSIVSVLTESVYKLYGFQKKMKDTDQGVGTLIGELTATKAALRSLGDIIESKAHLKQSAELQVDINSSISACRSLVNIIGVKVAGIPTSISGVDLAGRLRFIIADHETVERFSRLSRILSALKIVTEGLECSRLAQQADILQDQHNRETFDRVRDDSSSLIVLYDALSITSRRTSVSSDASHLSSRFPGLDEFLLQHNVYMSTFRSLMRRGRSGGQHIFNNDDQAGKRHLPRRALQGKMVSQGFRHPSFLYRHANIMVSGHSVLSRFLIKSIAAMSSDAPDGIRTTEILEESKHENHNNQSCDAEIYTGRLKLYFQHVMRVFPRTAADGQTDKPTFHVIICDESGVENSLLPQAERIWHESLQFVTQGLSAMEGHPSPVARIFIINVGPSNPANSVPDHVLGTFRQHSRKILPKDGILQYVHLQDLADSAQALIRIAASVQDTLGRLRLESLIIDKHGNKQTA